MVRKTGGRKRVVRKQVVLFFLFSLSFFSFFAIPGRKNPSKQLGNFLGFRTAWPGGGGFCALGL
jgi:hypothetical protein